MLSIVILLISGGCKKDSVSSAKTMTYNLKFKSVLGITGTVTFTEAGGNTTKIDISLSGKASDLEGSHPASLCKNSEVEGGDEIVALNAVNATGKSSTTVPMSYSELVGYDGYIKVLKSSTEPNSILAQGDIGGNLILATNKTYTLNIIDPYKVSGTALFEKRVNGNTLVTISLTGTIAGQSYPVTINYGTILSGELYIVKTLNDVDGTTGKGYTNIRTLNSGVAKTYDGWMVYLGYINIYQTSVSLENIISQGNIGSN